MTNNIIYLVTNYDNSIPQKLHETKGLDLNIITEFFDKDSFFERTVTIDLDKLANRLIDRSLEVSGIFFFFCSSQIEEYKLAIFDVASEVARRGGKLVPSLAFYQSHENKFYQELYKSTNSISTPKCIVATHSNSEIDVELPVVLKPYSGFGSKDVTLVKDPSLLRKISRKVMRPYILHNISLIEIFRSVIKSKIRYKNHYPIKFGRTIFQAFIPNLKYDWKVLVFGERVYVLKRFTRKGDFRASGSGNFDYSAIASDKLISFAVTTRKLLDTPFVSLDIAESTEDFSIIEYQSVHFGLATVMNAKCEYIYVDGLVQMASIDKVDVDELFAESIINYCKESM